MKFNLSNPTTGQQRMIEIDEDRRLLPFYDRRIGQEVALDHLGEEFVGAVGRITGGNDKQGFPMMQGVLTPGRVRLLFRPGMHAYNPRRDGCFRRKSIRGCITSSDISVLAIVLVKKGESEIPGLTDSPVPARLGPKRANRIRKFFGLTKEEDVTKFVVKRPLGDEHKANYKRAKIQRLVTAKRLTRKRREESLKKRHFAIVQQQKKEYEDTVREWKKSLKEARAAELAKKKKKIVA